MPSEMIESGESTDWLAKYRDGDPEAFGELVRAFEARLIQFFYRLCWDRARSEDLTQNLFLKLIRASERYRPEGKLSTYVFRVATNLWIDHYRASRPERQFASLDQVLLAGAGADAEGRLLERGELGDRSDDPVATAAGREESARLRAAVERLTQPHRLVFELAVLQQLPYSQVSEVLDVPVGTVKSRMHNTVRALREILAPAEDGGDAGFRGGEERAG